MNSFDLELDEKSEVGSEFMARVVNEIRRAVSTEKRAQKLTQQQIADRIGTSRAVINRQIQGYENLTARRIAEILWAVGWEPCFEARKIPNSNEFDSPGASYPPRAEMTGTSTTSGTTLTLKPFDPASPPQMRAG